MATPTEVEPNRIFGGDFRIIRLLGEGGMGAVYLAMQQSTSTHRALKLMQRELVEEPRMRERFGQEARLGSRIASDHVVQVIAAGVDEGSRIPWIAMELLRGETLDRYLAARGPLPHGELRFVCEQLCHALAAAHAEGIVHRDLKPSNVFLSVPRVVGLAYVVKVLDFGVAKVLAEAKTTRTAAVGTPLYMAPEQYQGGLVTPACDVWALGLVVLELCTGTSYWKAAAGGEATPASVMFETCIGELVPASARARELGVDALLPAGFDDWFGRCMRREPSERFASAREAGDALMPLLGAAKPPAEPLVAEQPVPSGPVAAIVLAEPTNVVPPGKELARHPAPAALVGTAPEPAATLAESARANATDCAAVATATVTASSWVAAELGPTLRRRKRIVTRALLAAGALAAVASLLVAFAVRLDRVDPAPSRAKVATLLVTAPTAAAARLGLRSQFASEGMLSVQGRLSHRQVSVGESTESYVLIELRGSDQAPAQRAPVHLALVIDRSGSMSGERLRNAKAAAEGAVERLRSGDMVSVTAFDTTVHELVPPTVLGELSRPRVLDAIRGLGTGSDTCISCGIEAALRALGAAPNLVNRILLLSDGAANVAVRDVPGFSRLGREAQRREVSISTIGVGIDYNERILSALSRESNGRHYYAETEASLPRIFDAETAALQGIVATGTEARIELSPGVELIELLDRVHRVEGSKVIIPLGQFSRGEQKTVLMKISVARPDAGQLPVCKVVVSMREPLGGGVTELTGSLETTASANADPNDLDAAVEARARRSETARSLVDANDLFARGKPAEADRALGTQVDRLEQQKQRWASRRLAPSPSACADLEDQARSLREARAEYRAAAAAQPAALAARSAPARANARVRAMEAFDMAL